MGLSEVTYNKEESQKGARKEGNQCTNYTCLLVLTIGERGSTYAELC